MGGYIGATAVGLTTTAADVQGDITSTDTTPEVILKNTTETDADGSRDGKITFKGEQSGGEESTLAQIQSSHDGTADDEKGDLIFKTNDGSDGTSPTERVRIDSNGSILTATLGTDNVHLGEGAGVSIASGGNQNTLIGKNAGTALTTGDDNVAVGHSALSTEDGNGRNTAVGYEALKTLNAGADGENVAIGYRAGKAVTEGIQNTLVGVQAGDALTHADYNVAVGRNALSNDTQGHKSVAIGVSALNTQNHTSSTDALNVAVGHQAGNSVTTGTHNTFLGPQAGFNMTTGSKNTIVGQFDGNNHNLDLRTNSNHIVLSDGDGQPRMFYESNQWFAGNLTAGSYWPALASVSGQSAIMLGTTSGALAVTTHDAVYFNKNNGDGTIVLFYSAGGLEGTISISGSTTSFNGGHLSRWSQLADGSRDNTLVKGTVMTNLDQMAVWEHDAVAEGDTIKNAMGETVTATADDVADAYTENNEQLNCMAVSSVEGDPNVAGVFVDWDDQDDGYNDLRIAMTGDMVIRIAQGTTVARGDLLMSAGDGTAKPQGDDIVRSKTIAKVTSTNVSHTYDDGSYLVPCVLMAC